MNTDSQLETESREGHISIYQWDSPNLLKTTEQRITIFIDTKQINKQTSKAAFCLLVISKAPETHKDSIKWGWHVFQTFPPTDQMTHGIMESAGNMIVTQHLSIFPDMMDFVHLKWEEWKNMRNYSSSRNAATVNVIWSTQIMAGMSGSFV